MLFLVRNHELIKNREKMNLTAAVSAAGVTLTVKAVDTNSLSDDDWVIVGEIGTENAEVLQVNGATADGTSITIDRGGSGGARYAHSIGEPVYRIPYNQIELSRATTETGSKSVLATNEVQPDDEYTRYEDVSNTTGYGFVRFKNSQTSTFSEYSDAIPYTGYVAKSLGRMLKMVRRRLNESDVKFIDDEDIIEELNEKQRDIAHERLWPFYEVVRSDSLVADQREYTIDDNVVYGKIHTVKADSQPLIKIDDARESMLLWDSNTVSADPSHYMIWNNKIRLYPLPSSAASTDTLNGDINATATTIVLTDASDFRAPGRALIESEIVSYEAVESGTDLVGCQRGLEGTTAASHVSTTAITERDIIYTAHEEPAELADLSDETAIPDPDVLVNGAAMELALSKLNDQVLHDRLKIKYDEGKANLREKFGSKGSYAMFRIKDKSEFVRDTGSVLDPNRFPENITD